MRVTGVAPWQQQQGVALITALLVAALGTILAVAMAHRQQVEIRRTENLVNWQQAAAFADAVVDWGRLILARDGESSTIDVLDEPWASLLPPIVIEEWSLWARIEDLQGRLNLNDLTTAGPAGEVTRVRFLRLLDYLDLDYALLEALIDWQDADSDVVGPGGAEDDYYSRLTPPYRTANRAFTDLSELRLVRGVSPEVYRRLVPHIAALPRGTALNVNTASAVVLATLSDALDPVAAESFGEQQRDGGYASVAQFAEQPQFDAFALETAGLGVSSNHFLLTAAVNINQFTLREQRELVRDGGQVRSTTRRYGGFD